MNPFRGTFNQQSGGQREKYTISRPALWASWDRGGQR